MHDVSFTSGDGNSSLVELYTSEGCSSCPPAEDWLGHWKDSPHLWKEIFPVNFHVDYWDNLGWPDRFAKAAYTARQRAYAARLGQDSVYTPEFVVDGAEFRGWFHGSPLPDSKAKRGQLTVTVHDGKLSASYAPAAGESGRDLVLNVGKDRVDAAEVPSSGSDAPAAVVGWVSTRDGAILQIAGGWTGTDRG
jgi:hypothetical protein